jgi:hypothetical protein
MHIPYCRPSDDCQGPSWSTHSVSMGLPHDRQSARSLFFSQGWTYCSTTCNSPQETFTESNRWGYLLLMTHFFYSCYLQKHSGGSNFVTSKLWIWSTDSTKLILPKLITPKLLAIWNLSPVRWEVMHLQHVNVMNNCFLFDAELVCFLDEKSMIFSLPELRLLFTLGDFSTLALITLVSLTFHFCFPTYVT